MPAGRTPDPPYLPLEDILGLDILPGEGVGGVGQRVVTHAALEDDLTARGELHQAWRRITAQLTEGTVSPSFAMAAPPRRDIARRPASDQQQILDEDYVPVAADILLMPLERRR
eukprot:755703-Hanusia_phi.AAC.2